MKDVLRRLIIDFQRNPLPPGVPRDGAVLFLPEMITAIAGVRRCGKSYLTRQIIHDRIKTGKYAINQVCYLDFDNEKIAFLGCEELGLIDAVMVSLHTETGINTPFLFVFDEIHKIPGWELFVIRLSRNPLWEVVVTGSSARLLWRELAVELRGKSIVKELFPFSFREFLRLKKVDEHDRSTVGTIRIQKAFDEYLRQGGFPAAANLEGRAHELLLQQYFRSMIARDIIELNNLSQPQAWIRLLHQLLVQNACPMTKKSAYEFLRSCGFNVGREKVVAFLDHARDAYVVDFVDIYSDSVKQKEQNYKKVYAIDWGLVQANTPAGDERRGRHLENIVFMELKRRGCMVNYFLTRTGREVDFIASDARGKVEKIIQVSYDLDREPRTAAREISALQRAAHFLGHRETLLLTYDQEKILKESGITIYVRPVWNWLLEE
jgi:hypothetical protein